MEKLNLYGDSKNPVMGGHFGVDIAMQRADDLDNRALLYARSRPGMRALDAASAGGGQAFRLAQAGADALALDIADYSIPFLEAAKHNGVADRCQFLQCDLRDYKISDLHEPFDIIVCQRMVHYVPFDVAVKIVTEFGKSLAPDGYLFISASGLSSELGVGYSDKYVSIEGRYKNLTPAMAEKHAIHGPVCLYAESDMALLIDKAGLKIEHVYSSAFGNIKAVASR